MSLRRIPIKGWKKNVHVAAAFDTLGEYATACVLDSSSAIEWWFRNDPAQIRVPTPVGFFEPDFVYKRTGAAPGRYGLLEIKGEFLWDGPGSRDRIKSAAACAWADAISHANAGVKWDVAVTLDQDAREASTFEDLVANAADKFESP